MDNYIKIEQIHSGKIPVGKQGIAKKEEQR